MSIMVTRVMTSGGDEERNTAVGIGVGKEDREGKRKGKGASGEQDVKLKSAMSDVICMGIRS